MTFQNMLDVFGVGIFQTLYMVSVSLIIAYLIGLPLGIILVITDKDGLKPSPIFNKILGTIINITRSLPFFILLILLIPFTRFIVGTFIGSTAVIIPLSISAIPFVARLTESHFKEVDKKVIEMLKVMGATPIKIIIKGYIGESFPALIRSIAITAIALIGYSAMAGAVGGGGLGDIAIRYGFQKYDYKMMLIAVVILIIIVQIIQSLFSFISKIINKI